MSSGSEANRSPGRRGTLWFGLLGLVGLWICALLVELPEMERDLGAGVLERLRSAGFHRLSVGVDGRDVTLTGAVAGPRAAASARQLAGAEPGVRVVLDATSEAPIGLPWLRAARSSDGLWILEGTLPDAASRDAVLALFGGAGGGDADALALDPESASAQWLPLMEALPDTLRALENVSFEAGAGTLSVAGVLRDGERYPELIGILRNKAEGHGMVFENRVAILPGQQSKPSEIQ